jgi:serine/threonine protein phosphatase PrpC
MGSRSNRPTAFPPGTPLSEHYTVEGLVRLSEGRMFYLVNDSRPDRPKRFCWDCGEDETPRAEEICTSCGADLSPRRFLVSARWNTAGFEPYAAFFDKQLDHPGLALPVDLFHVGDVMCAVIPWGGEGLMIDEGAPLDVSRVLDLGQRMTGMLAFLHAKGVQLASLNQANLLVTEDDVQLFDPEIGKVFGGPVPKAERGAEVAMLGAILLRYTPVDATELRDFLLSAEEGAFASPGAFGKALLKRFPLGEVTDAALAAGAMTDVGLCRMLNEDNWNWAHLRDDIELHVVADGMGGHEAGEVASAMAVRHICLEARKRLSEVRDISSQRLENVLEESFRVANNAIKDHSERMGNDMGTTMVATLVMGNKLAYMANVGDSRGYLLRDQALHQVTQDHSLVARMVEQNRITREEARHHPHSNILLRTVGTERDVEVDIFSVELEKGDKLLMCSDGLWGEVEDEDIEAILNHYQDPRIACRELIRAAHHGGGRDNITTLLVHIPES